MATAPHTPPSDNILDSALLRGRSLRRPWRYVGGGAAGRIPPACTRLTTPLPPYPRTFLLIHPRHRKVDIRNQATAAEAHVLQRNGIHKQSYIVLVDTDPFH